METVKTKKSLNYPLLLGIIDSVLLFLVLAMTHEYYRKDDSFGSFMLFWISVIAVNLLLSFFLKKSYYAGITMIFWGLFRRYIPYVLKLMFGIESESFKHFQKLFCEWWSPIMVDWLPVLAGVLGILTLLWAKKAVGLTEEEKKTFIERRSVFIIISAFYLGIFLLLVANLGSINFYSSLPAILFNTFGNGIGSISYLLQSLGNCFDFEIVEKIFDYDYVSLWCYALLPSYLVYLGVHHPFSEKTSKPLCVIGTALTLITSIGVIRQFSDKEDMTWNLLLVIISLVCILGGYFYFCKKLPEWSYALVGCGFLIYAPMILLAILLAICYFIFKAIFKDRPTTPKQPRKWEVTENGVTYTIEETHDGKFYDDCNQEWRTDNDGVTFYRKK